MTPIFRSRSAFAFSISLISLIATSSCQTGSWGAPAGTIAQTGACADTRKVFSSTGAAEVLVTLEDLPAGEYVRANSEVYVASNETVGGARAQFLELYASSTRSEQTLRCSETNGQPTAFVTESTVPVSLTRYRNASFDVDYRVFNLDLNVPNRPRLQVSEGGNDRSTPANALMYSIGLYWNGGTQWVRRSGEVYEFLGRRIEGSRTIHGKAVFTRRDLPANSL